ncbi:hypothetical protein RRG08_042369 [Elysia crispata]|uniref:Uncharacterized protein n=1 Tax=Elysia crispata TaxID=231223 RepID=A0AAE1DDD7_9GAST|nr:hypothetical protein RRG08_042369 [Elysia crispata]
MPRIDSRYIPCRELILPTVHAENGSSLHSMPRMDPPYIPCREWILLIFHAEKGSSPPSITVFTLFENSMKVDEPDNSTNLS